MENKRQHPRKRGSATDLASIGRDAVNNIDVVRHRCVALDARKPMTICVVVISVLFLIILYLVTMNQIQRPRPHINGRENTSLGTVLDHLGLTPYLHSITLLIMMGLMAGISNWCDKVQFFRL